MSNFRRSAIEIWIKDRLQRQGFTVFMEWWRDVLNHSDRDVVRVLVTRDNQKFSMDVDDTDEGMRQIAQWIDHLHKQEPPPWKISPLNKL